MNQRAERVMTDAELEAIDSWYPRLRKLSANHPVIMDNHGTVRWKQNTAVTWAMDRNEGAGIDLNAMKVAYARGEITRDDYMSFYRQIGYSLSAYVTKFEDELNEIIGG